MQERTIGSSPLTTRQRYWLDHLTAAAACGNTASTLVGSLKRKRCRFGIVLRSAKTAKVNRIEPYRYLRLLFTELPKANSLEDIEALFPPKQKAVQDEAA